MPAAVGVIVPHGGNDRAATVQAEHEDEDDAEARAARGAVSSR
jgi:hypothetical protein